MNCSGGDGCAGGRTGRRGEAFQRLKQWVGGLIGRQTQAAEARRRTQRRLGAVHRPGDDACPGGAQRGQRAQSGPPNRCCGGCHRA